MEPTDNDDDKTSDPNSEFVSKINNIVDMISCYSAMISHLRYCPNIDGMDLLLTLEDLNQKLLTEANKLNKHLASRIRPQNWN